MSDKIDSIAEILPEELSESTVEQIAELVDSVIHEQVEHEITTLNAKVQAYLRLKIDEIKEQAITELELENETFKNARLFETMKAYMAMELSQGDEDNAVASIKEDYEKLEQEVSFLTEELDRALVDNQKFNKSISVLSDQLEILESVVTEREEEIQSLEEDKEAPFKSSEQAYVIAENLSRPNRTVDNEFLTEEVMKFMPFTQDRK